MTRRNWKSVHPTSLTHAMELCLEYGREKRNLSVDRVADLIGQKSRHTLYKWLSNGRMPALLIPAFENVCGIDFMTRYLAASGRKLLIDIPRGKRVAETEINDLHVSFSEAIKLLIKFYDGKAAANDTLAALNELVNGLVWHHTNVGKAVQPELELNNTGEQ